MKKTNVARILDREKVEYRVLEYKVDPEYLGAEAVAKKTGQTIESVFKTLVLKGDKTGYLVACIQGHKNVALKPLAKLSGNKKVEMIPMKDIQKITGYIRGGCSPIGMKKTYPTFIDESAYEQEKIVMSAGVQGKQVELAPQDLIRLLEANMGSISE